MALIANNSAFIADLMKVLGIDHNKTRAFTLHAEVDKAVTIELTQYVDTPPGELEIKRYHLTMEEIDEEDHKGK